MYTLDIDAIKKEAKKYLIFSAICFVFGIIYELFSHQVYSYFMILAFLIPLVFGGGIYKILSTIKKPIINNVSNDFYKTSIYTFTFGSLMKGVLDIYGTTNKFLIIYLTAGLSLLLLAFVFSINVKHS